MLKKIFREIVKREHDAIKREELMFDLIDQITKPYEGHLSDHDMDTLEDLLCAVALAGEEAGFELGAKFTVRLFQELTD